MQNTKDELKIAIESKMTAIGKLINEYEELGGEVTNATIIKYDDDDFHHLALNGTGEDIAELIYSNEHMTDLLTGYQLFSIFNEMENDEE